MPYFAPRSHYDPNQPRVPAGEPGAGRWTDAGGGENGDIRENISRDRTSQAASAARPVQSSTATPSTERADRFTGPPIVPRGCRASPRVPEIPPKGPGVPPIVPVIPPVMPREPRRS